MNRWEKNLIHTTRGTFEIFTKGHGHPLCVTHNYSEFNETGDYFADAFTGTHKVILVNLREAGSSERAVELFHLSMLETIFDLESIREALGYSKWSFAGHSTGGMLGIIYGIHFSNSLSSSVIVGSAARDYFTFSENCIYNQKHPNFDEMQMLIEKLKKPNLPFDERKLLSVKRTKFSLYYPENYEKYFNKEIEKKISATRMNFFNRELQIYDVTKKLKLITVPTLILCGKYDVQCPLEYSIEMNQEISNSKLVIFNESNHYPFLEERETFTQEVLAFFHENCIKL